AARKLRPARTSVRRAVHELTIFTRRLNSRRERHVISNADRAILIGASHRIQDDLRALLPGRASIAGSAAVNAVSVFTTPSTLFYQVRSDIRPTLCTRRAARQRCRRYSRAQEEWPGRWK